MADHEQNTKNRWYRNDDVTGIPGPDREIRGYGRRPPRVRWNGDAKLAINVVVNYEEGSEHSFAMGDGHNEGMHEIPFHVEGQRDLAKESFFEYGSRAGIWRLFRVFDRHEIPATVFGSAVALERNPAVADKMIERGDDLVGHGYRWIDHYEYSRDEEKVVIDRAMNSFESLGLATNGWYCREMSVNTRELLVEDGRFAFDSDYYGDDIPYWTQVKGKSHLVVPYSLVVNDCRYVMGTGYASPTDFVDTAKRTVLQLLDDGDDCGRMMSIGLHPRITGNPARAHALAEFITWAKELDGVTFMRRSDIADQFIAQVPAPAVTDSRPGEPDNPRESDLVA